MLLLKVSAVLVKELSLGKNLLFGLLTAPIPGLIHKGKRTPEVQALQGFDKPVAISGLLERKASAPLAVVRRHLWSGAVAPNYCIFNRNHYIYIY